jgi:hypothetical protein
VQSVSVFREKFEQRIRARPQRCTLEMTDRGVLLGADTILLAADEDDGPSDRAEERLLALLGVAYKRRVASDVIAHVRKASALWTSGNKSLARIHLAFAHLPRLESPEDAFRLLWADELIGAGVAPGIILEAIDFEAGTLDLRKFNPNQPRVPAGNGRESGRWGTGGGDTSHLVTHRSASPVHFDKDQAIRNDIVTIAQTQVGSTAWADETTNGNFGPGRNKCNLFVHDILKAAGASPGEPNEGKWPLLNKYPPTAGQWADPDYKIPGWDVLGPDDVPQPGDVVAQRIQYLGSTGHVMIVGPNGTVIGTGDSGDGPEGTIENIPMPAQLGPRPLGPLVFRRWYSQW